MSKTIEALTTTFTPPASCTAVTYVDYLLLGPSGTGSSAANCLPPHYSFGPTSSFFYSPGVCPYGYYANDLQTETIGSVEETRAVCCPSGYVYQTATRDDGAFLYFSTLGCTSIAARTETITATVNGKETALILSPRGGINAWSVQVRWQSTDFATPPATLIRTTTVPLPTGSLTTSNPTSTSSPSNSDSSSDLSTNAKIGIGIGVPIAVLLLATAVFFGYKVGKERRRGPPDYGHPFHQAYYLEGKDDRSAIIPPQELSSETMAQELSLQPHIKPQELPV